MVKQIRAQAKTRMPSAWMFHGTTGVGKTTIARILAVAYQCEHQKLWGDPCAACWDRQGEFAIHEINASEVNGVDEIRKVAEMGRCRPMGGSKRVIILDEAQRLTSPAQNLLLKDFEDTTSGVIWIICTTEPTKILPTLRRRCMMYAIKPLGFDSKEELLKKAAASIDCKLPLEPLIEKANEMQVSSPALLLMALEKYVAGALPQVAMAAAETPSQLDTLRLCKAVTAGSFKGVQEVLKDSVAEDARYVRASVCGWLRGCLMRESNPKRQTAIADSLRELASGTAPLEDSLMMWWLWGVLQKVCGRFRS